MRKVILTSTLALLLSSGVTFSTETVLADEGVKEPTTVDRARNIKSRQKLKEIGDITTEKGSNYVITSDLNTQTAEQLVQKIMGQGVKVTNVRYTGTPTSAGSFTTDDASIFGFKEGAILSTGDIKDVDGSNTSSGITGINSLEGDQELDLLIPGYETYDATVLEFDFIPESNMLSFEYVFSSDEYNEFVNTEFNDVFGFFLNGKNIALIPNTTKPVSINNVNNGNEEDGTNATNPQYFRDNTSGTINTEMDGLTTVLTATAYVVPGKVNTIRLAIADAGDYVLDSNVCIKATSFNTVEKDAIQFKSISQKVNESAGTATVTVERTGNATEAVSVSYYTEDGSAKAESDYKQTSGKLNFNSGVKSLSFEVPLLDDSEAEGTETVNLYIKDVEGNAFIGDNKKSRLYIEDNDSAGTEYEKLTIWEEMPNVSADKNFIVKFNEAIDANTVTAENFYVTDANNEVIKEITPEITFNKLSVIMKTNGFQYNSGSTYHLNISRNVKNALGKNLSKDIKMSFNVKNLE